MSCVLCPHEISWENLDNWESYLGNTKDECFLPLNVMKMSSWSLLRYVYRILHNFENKMY